MKKQTLTKGKAMCFDLTSTGKENTSKFNIRMVSTRIRFGGLSMFYALSSFLMSAKTSIPEHNQFFTGLEKLAHSVLEIVGGFGYDETDFAIILFDNSFGAVAAFYLVAPKEFSYPMVGSKLRFETVKGLPK